MYNTVLTLSGTLMWKDTPLAVFSVESDSPVYFEQLDRLGPHWPYLMQKECDGWSLIEALKDRAVPTSRQRILEDLKNVGIIGYDLSEILKFQNASSWGDNHWVRFDNEGPQTYAELRKKIGYIN